MSLFEQASLIVTPNAFKAGKLYSIKGADLDVVRATTATRVNSAGLIELVPRNLVQYSEQFENATWTKSQLTISANAITSPNGYVTADKIIPSVVSAQHILRVASAPINLISGVSIATYSIYAKQGEYYNFRLGTSATASIGATFNLSNGTISNNTAISASIQDVGNGWYRCIVRGLVGSVLDALILNNLGVDTFAGNAVNGLFLWGAQIEETSTATDYYPTTDRLNIPRLDYTNGSCPSILVEPQRTNIFPKSQTTSTWVFTNISRTANNGISPDGTQNADLLAATSSGAVTFNSDSSTSSVVIGQPFIFSFFIKLNAPFTSNIGLNIITVRLRGTDLWTPRPTININIETGEVTNFTGASNILSQNYGNGWYRISFGATATGTGTTSLQTNTGLTMDGGSFFIWGFQFEQGSNATSYIPTVASAVTRNADVISKTGISDLINSEEGCFYVEASSFINGGNFRQFSLSNGTDNSRLTMGWSSVTSRLLARLDIGGTNIVNSDIFSFNQTSNNKVLFKWGGGNFKVFINGVESLNLTSLTMPTANLFTKLGFDRGSSAGFFEGNVKEVIVFPVQLTDQECINLTTL
jgi:hypothetical protein